MPESPEVTEVADSLTDSSDRELTARERILLWVASTRFGVDELDAYEFVLPEPARVSVGDRSLFVDGLLAEEFDSGHNVVLFLYRAPVSGGRVVADVSALLSAGGRSQILRTIAQQSPALSAILERAKVVPLDDHLHLSIVTIAPVSRLSKTSAVASVDVQTEVLDRRALESLRNAVTEPGPVPGRRTVAVHDDELIETSAGEHRIVIAVVTALEALDWPEIESRRLFDLNVRLGLGMNRVRRSLDEAFSTTAGQANILAYHNGLTVVTHQLDVLSGAIQLDGISVVNGAQTLLALNENKATITPDLRLLVKFVELTDVLEDAHEIAVRSNSQNPVTTRNLRALDATQIRLRRELVDYGFDFETRPDRGRPTSWTTLQNDVVAQWLCAVYLEEPWLAVKRTSLFLQENYARVYPPDLKADRVVFAARIRQAIESKKAEFPETYHRAWSLAALTACYLTGQILRSSRDLSQLLMTSTANSQETAEAVDAVDRVVDVVISVLRDHDEAASFNNYYVDFKSKQTLLRLAAQATRSWLLSEQVR